MKKLELEDAKPYDAPGHFGCVSLRLHHKETTGSQNFSVGLSHFLPKGGAEMGGGDLERVYYVISGTLSVTDSNGKEISLGPTDSLYIASGEKRSIANKTNLPVTMLVIMSYPK